MNRRSYLAAVLGVGTAGSGCLAGVGGETARIADLTLLNLDDRTHRITVAVGRGDERLYRESFSVAPVGEGEGDDGVLVEEAWMDDPGRYVVRAWLDDAETPEERRVPSENRGGNCYGVVVRAREGGWLDVPMEDGAAGCGDG
ncbi:hypothetical protein [Halomarina ordinaria]|uniref:Uncharacterized protein n=1 Tax=Halomarina ordinaria TaxID=3033939 RepID=A0ABD5UCH4_9EURY|nr:hypothetical protein [Halomarina sp. PSRA2]